MYNCDRVKRPSQSAMLFRTKCSNLKIFMRFLRRKILPVMTVNFTKFLHFAKCNNFIKKCAFTLAEVLITLGIIGVVAAITLSIVINNHKEKVTVTRLKHAYSILSQAFNRIVPEDGTPDEWGMTGMNSQSHVIMANKFVPYFKIIENCVGKSDTFVKNNCTKVFYSKNAYSSFVIQNGTTIVFRNYNEACTSKYGSVKDVCGEIIVDTNGVSFPNKPGVDVFVFYIYKNGIIPKGTKGDFLTFKRMCDITNSNPISGFTQMTACAAWVIYNENLDYLHCNDLNWDVKIRCK